MCFWLYHAISSQRHGKVNELENEILETALIRKKTTQITASD